MRSFRKAALAAILLASSAVPAFGAVLINSANTGYNFSVDYDGQVGGAATNLLDALSTFTFTGVSNSGLTYNFNYSVKNNSSVSSRLTAFGFNVDPTASSASSTGAFPSANLGDNFPEGVRTVDVCFEADANGNCTGGSGGLNSSATGTGTFALTFAQVMSSVSLDSFVTRFQSINPTINGSSSGVGLGTVVQSGGNPITAPEPGTWLMMLGGFGLVGFAMRRREGRLQLSQLA